MVERKCLMCGKPFSAEIHSSRKYCDDCFNERRRVQLREVRKRKKEKPVEIKQKPAASSTRSELKKEDKEYCKKCIYRGKFSVGYLCDYNLITRTSRRCKPGVGCTKRELEE